MPTCSLYKLLRRSSLEQRTTALRIATLSAAENLPCLKAVRLGCIGLLLSLALSASAQVLARPGWAGSGVTVETWWRRAVFYRIDVARFQDTTGNGRGDLAGVTQRLEYLQSLGVDAIIVDTSPAEPLSAENFDDLTRQAANHHLRVLVALSAPKSARSDATANYLAEARTWLNQGAAGLYVAAQPLAALNNPALETYLVHALRKLTNSFPGDRLLLADAAASAPAPVADALAHDAQLIAAPPISLATPDAASLRRQMLADLPSSPAISTLLQANRRLPPNLTEPQRTGLERALAAALLASRTAVLIDYGQELGEQQPNATEPAPLMQWTPTNLTRQPKPAAPENATPKSGGAYGTFHPYVKPLPRNLFPPPSLPDVVLSDTPPAVDPNSLPGFTSGDIQPALAADRAPNAATANVAVEDANPDSLLNLYRRLIQLHHENASIRNGAQDMLDLDGLQNAVVWLRLAPPGSRTSGTVIAACNLSAKPITLPLDSVAQLHRRRGILRDLLRRAAPPPLQPAVHGAVQSLTVAPYALSVAELQP